MAKEDKLKALDAAIAQIERQYGKGSVMKLGDNSANMNVETVPTGSLSLDIALGLGGLPKGRIIEIYGPESSGKTTVALHCVAEVQKRGGIAGFIDAEHALDPVYAKNIGVDIDNLYISQPDCGEQALEITETMVRSGAVDIVIVDSVAALVPKAEIDGDMGDSHVGLQARLMSQALRKLTGVISKSNCIVIFINQLREKVGVMFGNPETTTGGRALKFYASVRLDVRRVEALKQAGEVIGNHTRVKIVKNKVAPPFREAEFDIMFGQGISKEGDILDLAANVGIINKSGAWYAYEGDKIGQGRENAKTYLRENPEFCKMIEEQVREHYFAQDAEEETEADESADAGKDAYYMIYVTEYESLGRGKLRIRFDNGAELSLYRSEAKQFKLAEDVAIDEELYQKLVDEVVSKRATKRAMHLLERMDRTEHQLREKLRNGGYPEECVDAAIAYVKQYHYIDDLRYACTYVRLYQDRLSRLQIKMKLAQKGIDRDLIEQALEEEYETQEIEQIYRLLEKRNYVAGQTDEKEYRRTYQYLMRRGFKSTEITKAMRERT